ncbi:hypothetical protein PSTG_12801 [Puccinia striiformis f. sp. tritici PST-78]|uniref:Uncharacterized protein n=1 Tax=Puccinia striiformis f. sp. tritici PST-78 TaxID=1165861 RepID=A0A0L0V3D2_9BASI|nr:hypothetical protein PSTG_12801 [Puccinia striiformis f. sp. tritici PST-78]
MHGGLRFRIYIRLFDGNLTHNTKRPPTGDCPQDYLAQPGVSHHHFPRDGSTHFHRGKHAHRSSSVGVMNAILGHIDGK